MLGPWRLVCVGSMEVGVCWVHGGWCVLGPWRLVCVGSMKVGVCWVHGGWCVGSMKVGVWAHGG